MKKIKSIFTDKASLILREMLKSPDKKWIIEDFSRKGVSAGWVSEILGEMAVYGYIERVGRGPLSYSIMRFPDRLIRDWIKWYNFKYNTIYSFYSPSKNIEDELVQYFRKNNIPYALTLFSGARKAVPYVNDPRIHIYIPAITVLGDLVRFKGMFNLLELKESGNVHLAIPYYKNSIFEYVHYIKGVAVVSYLQLYLDLYTFSPRGKEQAEYLVDFVKREGISLA